MVIEMWKEMSKYDLMRYSSSQNIKQTEEAIMAALTEEPVIPPFGIDPLRWKNMVKCMKQALAKGLENEI